jgi:hypothetical protein
MISPLRLATRVTKVEYNNRENDNTPTFISSIRKHTSPAQHTSMHHRTGTAGDVEEAYCNKDRVMKKWDRGKGSRRSYQYLYLSV